MNQLNATILIIAIAAVGVMSGCKKDKPAPGLPPTSSMVMDYSEFNSGGSGKSAHDGGISPYDSSTAWGWAATNVVIWNVVLTVNLAIPVAAFVESFNPMVR